MQFITFFLTKDPFESYYVETNPLSKVSSLYKLGSCSRTPAFTFKNIEKIKFNVSETVKVSVSDSQDTCMLRGMFIEYNAEDLNKDDYVKIMSAKVPDIFEDTNIFQKYFELYNKDIYGFLPEENMKVKLNHLQEEMAEILSSYKEKDLEGFCDGLIDLIYVASGTLNLMNMPANELWNDVQLRNMNKVRATNKTVGKRNSTFDVVKPKGWKGPKTKLIIDYFSKYYKNK